MRVSGNDRINLFINDLVVVLAFSIPLYRKWVSIVAPLIVLLWLFEGRLKEKFRVLRSHPLTLAVLAFIAINLLSVLWSSRPGDGLAYVDKYRYLLLIPVVATSLRPRFRRHAELALMIGAGLSLLLSYATFFGLIRVGDAYPLNPAVTMSHLDYSMVLAVVALIALDRLLDGPFDWRRGAPLMAFFLLVVGGLLINIGRSGQAAFAGGLALVVGRSLARRLRRTAIAAISAVVIAAAIAYLATAAFPERIDSGLSELRLALTEHRLEGSVGQRIAGAIVAGGIVRRHPVLGTGVGDNMPEFRRLLDTEYPGLKAAVSWFPHLHNQYLQVATELGLVGLAGLLAMFACLLRGPYQAARDRGVAVILTGAYLIGFLGDPFLHKQLPLVLFATLAGIISAQGRSVFWDRPSTG